MSDCISRNAAKKVHCQICFENSICYRNPETCQELKAFDSIPAADVRPVVKATWKRIDYKPCGHDYECSSCGWKNDMEKHFCPNCGAMMEES